jgi:hypothetical protein
MENQKQNFCHDCKKEIEIIDEEIKNGVCLVYDLPAQTGTNGEKINVFKCNDCYAKDKSLTNFQPCEVYSRVVGYIRPVGQWHKGKQQEYKEREEFKNPCGGGCDCC